MPKWEEDLGETEESLTVERRVKSFALRNLSYKEAFKAVGKDTLIVLFSVALILGFKSLLDVLRGRKSLKTALKDYFHRELKEAVEEASKTFLAGAIYTLLRRGLIGVLKGVSLLKVILAIELLSVLVKNYKFLKVGKIDKQTFLRKTLFHTILTVVSLYGTSVGIIFGYHLAKDWKLSPLFCSVLVGFILGSSIEWIARKLLKNLL